ncbi:hypothetical protein J1N35_024954 [Gossypium stocksii]|uniref:Uncharacterized protein n=1 Tax=Gossypium stocksii TaxID=47602 RepID=A0A9D3V5Q1_9ROSI|nr:hypothetical protein J1N35_024954 [Gossypium stocksii]
MFQRSAMNHCFYDVTTWKSSCHDVDPKILKPCNLILIHARVYKRALLLWQHMRYFVAWTSAIGSGKECYKRSTQNMIVDALSKRTQEVQAQLLQYIDSIIWLDMWIKVMGSCLTNSKLQQLCLGVQQQPRLHPKCS